MEVAILTIAYHEERFIEGCIRQFYGFELPHLVLHSEVPWHGDLIGANNTPYIADNMGADVISGYWTSEAEQRNYGLEQLQDFDWVIICDADERYTRGAINHLLESLRSGKNDADVTGIKTSVWHVYWKTPEYEIEPPQTDYPLIAVTPKVTFLDKRATDAKLMYLPIPMYHFSYVRSDEEMWRKITSFEETTSFNPSAWYDSVWKTWTPESSNLHPVVPGQFLEATYRPAPDDIIKLL